MPRFHRCRLVRTDVHATLPPRIGVCLVDIATMRQLAEIRRVAEFVERPISDAEARRVADGMYGRAGLRFRKGQIGDWRAHFNDEHRRAFERVAGRQLQALGYQLDVE